MNWKNIKLPFLFFITIFSCSTKRDALGADNEIRVICSDVDKEVVNKSYPKFWEDIDRVSKNMTN